MFISITCHSDHDIADSTRGTSTQVLIPPSPYEDATHVELTWGTHGTRQTGIEVSGSNNLFF